MHERRVGFVSWISSQLPHSRIAIRHVHCLLPANYSVDCYNLPSKSIIAEVRSWPTRRCDMSTTIPFNKLSCVYFHSSLTVVAAASPSARDRVHGCASCSHNKVASTARLTSTIRSTFLILWRFSTSAPIIGRSLYVLEKRPEPRMRPISMWRHLDSPSRMCNVILETATVV
jgi:hypothetical protein